ncbi:hypothetical protein ACE38W_15010 [Chitinophaga sp. Hz27]|uniref:hypothetical protein n=1 Tax=Chitinophaga sp. Hz27 TaxID=3347169 RepID=UPI0035DA8B6C
MSDGQITRAVRQLAGVDLQDSIELILCSVDSVNEEENTCVCTPINGQTTVPLIDVQLMAEVNDGVLIVPAIGSSVMVLASKYQSPVVVMFSSLSKIEMIVGGASVEIRDGKITLNDGSFAGLVKVIELTNRLNLIETKINDMISLFNNHIHTGVQTGSGSSAVTSTPISGTLTPTTQTDIENTEIVHGSQL